jgi:hypothetical protein
MDSGEEEQLEREGVVAAILKGRHAL